MQLVIRNKTNGNSVDDGFGKQLRVIRDAFGVEKCFHWDVSCEDVASKISGSGPKDRNRALLCACAKQELSGTIRSIRDPKLIFSPSGGSLECTPNQPVHIDEVQPGPDELWNIEVIDPDKGFYFVVSECNHNWVLAEVDTLLVLQQKVDGGGRGQVWNLEVVGGAALAPVFNEGSKATMKATTDRKPIPKIKIRTKSISSCSDDDGESEDDEGDAATNISENGATNSSETNNGECEEMNEDSANDNDAPVISGNDWVIEDDKKEEISIDTVTEVSGSTETGGSYSGGGFSGEERCSGVTSYSGGYSDSGGGGCSGGDSGGGGGGDYGGSDD